MIGRPRNKRTETSIVDKEKAQMKAPMTHRNLPRFLGALAAAALLILALGAGSAGAAFGIENFDGEVIQEGGEAATQAGSHPYEAARNSMSTTIKNVGILPRRPGSGRETSRTSG